MLLYQPSYFGRKSIFHNYCLRLLLILCFVVKTQDEEAFRVCITWKRRANSDKAKTKGNSEVELCIEVSFGSVIPISNHSLG